MLLFSGLLDFDLIVTVLLCRCVLIVMPRIQLGPLLHMGSFSALIAQLFIGVLVCTSALSGCFWLFVHVLMCNSLVCVIFLYIEKRLNLYSYLAFLNWCLCYLCLILGRLLSHCWTLWRSNILCVGLKLGLV